MKWLRWQGLILFGLVMALMAVFWFILVDGVMKHAIQITGTRIIGAQVELAEADLHLLPLGITLGDLQVTNPERPMTNAVQAQRIELSLDGLKLLQRKIIVDTLSLDGIRFNTPRSRSGAIKSTDSKQKEPKTDKGVSEPSTQTGDTPFPIPNFQVPEVRDILAREKLETLEQIKQIQADIEAAQSKWQKQLAQAPDQKTFKAYQSRARKLQKGIKGLGDALKRANDIQRLQKDVDKDLKKIKKIKKNFERDQKNLKNKIKQLSAAPQKDIDRILKKYSLTADGLGNFSQLLFGDKIGSYTQQAIFWYQKLKPLLNKAGTDQSPDTPEKPARGKGIFVRFAEIDPLPDFLASHTDASIIIPAGGIRGNLEHITNQQAVLGLPLLFNFSGDKFENMESITFKGSLDHIDPKNVVDQFTAAVTSYRVKDVVLSDTNSLPIQLKKGWVDLNIAVTSEKELLDGRIQLNLKSAELTTDGESHESELLSALKSALADVNAITLTANLSGSLNDYSVRVTSDLDRVLKQALGRQVKKLTAAFEDQLRGGIMQKINTPLATTNDRMTELDRITEDISDRLNLGDSISKIL